MKVPRVLMPRWKANIMINTFALINFAAITGKLKEWVMIDHDCTIDAKSSSLQLMVASCQQSLIAALFSLLQLPIASVLVQS